MTNEEKNYCMFCHLAALSGFIIPFGTVLGPLIVWLMGKDKYPSVDSHGKMALNFQITLMIGMIACIPLIFVVIGIILLPILAILGIVFSIVNAVNVSNGKDASYPWSLKLVN